MYANFLEDLCCPKSGGKLTLKEVQKEENGNIMEATLIEKKTGTQYSIHNGIPRFVPAENYASSFGIEWNMFPKVQLDSANGTTISRDRFFGETGWDQNLEGEKILEAGCGMGRFTEIAVTTGAQCYSLDFSNAVDAAAENIGHRPNMFFLQASLYEIPFPKHFFDKIFCFGVLQHTPNVQKSFESLLPFLKPGGRLAIDVYAAPYNWFHPRQFFRPLTKRMKSENLHKMVEKMVPPLLKVSDVVASIPKVGGVLRYGVPVANYRGRWKLSDKQIKEWAILDTYDWFSPQYDQPQTAKTVTQWFEGNGFENIQIRRDVGIYVATGIKKF